VGRERRFTRAWVAWLIISGLGFAGIEAKALSVPGATLSEHVRQAFGFEDTGPVPELRRGLFYLLWGWFGLHIFKRTTGCVSCIKPSRPPV
jgi:hypothetical protein